MIKLAKKHTIILEEIGSVEQNRKLFITNCEILCVYHRFLSHAIP